MHIKSTVYKLYQTLSFQNPEKSLNNNNDNRESILREREELKIKGKMVYVIIYTYPIYLPRMQECMFIKFHMKHENCPVGTIGSQTSPLQPSRRTAKK